MLEAIRRILGLTWKELLAVLKDPRGRFTLLVPPVFQCLIYGYVATYDLNDVPYAVLDRDRSAASRDLVARLDGSRAFHRLADLYRTEDLKTAIDERRVLLVIGIDYDFERRLLLGQSADVQVIADGRNSNTAGTAHRVRRRRRNGVQRRLARPTARAARRSGSHCARGITRTWRRAGT